MSEPIPEKKPHFPQKTEASASSNQGALPPLNNKGDYEKQLSEIEKQLRIIAAKDFKGFQVFFTSQLSLKVQEYLDKMKKDMMSLYQAMIALIYQNIAPTQLGLKGILEMLLGIIEMMEKTSKEGSNLGENLAAQFGLQKGNTGVKGEGMKGMLNDLGVTEEDFKRRGPQVFMGTVATALNELANRLKMAINLGSETDYELNKEKLKNLQMQMAALMAALQTEMIRDAYKESPGGRERHEPDRNRDALNEPRQRETGVERLEDRADKRRESEGEQRKKGSGEREREVSTEDFNEKRQNEPNPPRDTV